MNNENGQKKENGLVRVLKRIFVKDLPLKAAALIFGVVIWFLIRLVLV